MAQEKENNKMGPKNSRHWSRDAIVYQIYPLSFQDSNGDGKGDLEGIIKRLDYLNGNEHSLGINTVWISPFYKSPMADHGYDVSDYKSIDPAFGTMETFERLVKELHKRDIKVIVDFVGNHTSSQHTWFKESQSSRENPKRDWYVWHDPKPDGDVPNNWLSVFGGSAWTYDEKTKQYYLHSFLKEQPDLNWNNPEVRKEMMNTLDFWVSKGVDGFRIDAIQHFLEDSEWKDDTLNPQFTQKTDDPYQTLLHDHSRVDIEKMTTLGSFVTEALNTYPDIFIIGEAYIGPKDLQKFYQLCPNNRFAPFNFTLISTPWNVADFKNTIDSYQAILTPENIPNYVFGNHDISRVATRIGEAKARITSFLQFTLPGMPFVYYGEEIGMTNGAIPFEAVKDFLSKFFHGFHPGRDLERTPMQWDDSPHAGFSNSKPWLPVNGNYKTVNVEHEKNDPLSMLSHYKSLIRVRKSTPVLRDGTYIARQSKSPNIFSFERILGDERFIILANFGDNIEKEDITVFEKAPSLIFSTNEKDRFQDISKELTLLPLEGYILRV